MVLAAVVQFTARDDLRDNLARAEHWVREAAARGAKWVGLPENTSFMGPEEQKRETAETLGEGVVSRWAKSLASELGIELLVGSLVERIEGDSRVFNTSILVGQDGEIHGSYRKIHLFDVSLADGTEYRESRAVKAGSEPVVVSTGAGALGMSICYDLRFPELYRQLVASGAESCRFPRHSRCLRGGIIGMYYCAHGRSKAWRTYSPLRSGASTGRGRTTYGHALIVDPWGTILAECADGEGIALAELKLERVRAVRAQIPCLQHRRLGACAAAG